MPVTMPRIVTVVPLQAASSPSVWMLVIGTMPSGPAAHGPGPTVPEQVVPHFVGVGVSGPLKSATLSSVSWVPSFLRANPPAPVDGWSEPGALAVAGRRGR